MRHRQEFPRKPDDPGTLRTTQRGISVPEFEAGNEFSDGLIPDRCDEFDDSSDLDDIDLSDVQWEAFLADDDELDPEPDPDDFCTFD